LPIRLKIRPEGELEERSFDFVYQPLRDEEGLVYGLLVVGMDVTGKVRARRALEESSARLNAVMEGLPIGLILADADGRLTYTNPELGDILGLRGEAEGVRAALAASKVYHPDERRAEAEELPLLRALRSARRVEAEEYVYEAPDGSRVWISMGAAPIVSRAGTVLGGVVAVQGIDERKKAEQALRLSEARFRAIADLVPDLLWRSDAGGATSWYNQRWLEYTGREVEKAAEFAWMEVIHPSERGPATARFREAMASGEPFRREHRLRAADGSYRWFLIQARPVRDERGRITHWFAAATDVHDQRMALEAAERA